MSNLEITSLPASGTNSEGVTDDWWGDLRDVSGVDVAVFHAMSNPRVAKELQYDASANRDLLVHYGYSSHYLIDRFGKIYRLAPEENHAWHAGKSIMPEPDNRTGIFAFSLGIELLANETDGYTEEQYYSLAELMADILSRIPITTILGHYHIATKEVREDFKTDPWNFDWNFFSSILIQLIGDKEFLKLKQVGDTSI